MGKIIRQEKSPLERGDFSNPFVQKTSSDILLTMRHPLILMAAGVSSRMKKALEQDSGIEIDPRLVEEANTLPKCMLSVGPSGTRFIDYLLWNAAKGGFRDIIVLLNPKDAVTRPYVESSIVKMDLGVSVHFAIQHLAPGREKPWGTGDAICQALEQFPLDPDDVYTISNSDNLCSESVFAAAFGTEENTIFSYDTSSLGIDPDDRVKYGLVISDRQNGRMVGIVEKPSLEEISRISETSDLSVNMNILTLSYSDTIEKLRNLVPHPVRDEKEVTDVFRELSDQGMLASHIVREALPDLTSKADIPKVQKYLADTYPEIQNYFKA